MLMSEVGVRRQRIQVTPSPLMELMHILFVLGRDRSVEMPWRDRFIQEHPDLTEQVRALWTDSIHIFPRGFELFMTVVGSGSIQMLDPVPFFDRFPQAVRDGMVFCQQSPRPQDHPERSRVIVERMEKLQDPGFQQQYVTLLRAIWDALGPEWERDGLPVIQVECSRFQQRVHEGATILDLLPVNHFLTLEGYANLVENTNRDYMVTPLYYSKGGYLTDLEVEGYPIFLGYGLATEGVHRETQRKATELASKLKAFSDPTRLTLLFTISELEVTVGDLARLLEISQPTVSGHLRILERAGLVRVRKKGVKAFYRSDAEAIAALLDETGRLLS